MVYLGYRERVGAGPVKVVTKLRKLRNFSAILQIQRYKIV